MSTTEEIPISEARASITELVNRVRLLGDIVILTSHGKRRAAVIPLELLDRLEDLDDATPCAKA